MLRLYRKGEGFVETRLIASVQSEDEKIVETEHAPSVPNACDLILQFFVQSLREKSSKSIKIRQNKIFD